jgi:universal stress protein A
MVQLKNIVVATDFSEPSATALDYGRELARRFGATLYVLHVADDIAERLSPEYYPIPLDRVQKEIDEAARKQLEPLVTAEDRQQLRALPVLRRSVSVAAAILEYAKETAADLIVIGTHGRRGMSRLIMGSVAERVVRMASCPVFSVHCPEHDIIVPDALVAVTKG